MRFECDSCHAKYKISDAKVAGRVVRFPCRKCDHRIVIDGRRGDVTVPAGAAYGSYEVTRRSEPAPSLAREGATVRQRRPSSPGRRRPPSVPPRRRSSVARRVSSSPAAASSALVGQHPGLAPPVPAASKVGARPLRAGKQDKAQWHVSVNDVPIGPIKLEEMAHKVDAGAVSEYSLVWREGFDEWRPLATVPELMTLLYERRSSGPPTRSRFSSLPPFVEAQTAIKQTSDSSSVVGPPKPPVHALGARSDVAGEFLPLTDALEAETSLPSALAEASQPPAPLGPAPVFDSAPPSGAFSGLPQRFDTPVSVPAVPPLAVVAERRTGASLWFWALLVAVAVFSGVIAVLAFDRYGDRILERVLGSTDAAVQHEAKRAAPPKESDVEEAVPAGEGVDETETPELEAGSGETEASEETELVEGGTAVSDQDSTETAASESPEPEPLIEPPTPTEDGPAMEPAKPRRRLRAKRAAETTADSSDGIKKLGDDSLSAEEQKLLADFGSGTSAGVAKIDVTESGSTASKRDPLDSKAVSATVNTNKPRLQRCYERAIRGQQSPAAVRMNVSINVAASGRVSDVEVDGSGPGGLKECIEASIRRWRFPASSEGGPAKFPIVFSAN